jgi:hypothetical protein
MNKKIFIMATGTVVLLLSMIAEIQIAAFVKADLIDVDSPIVSIDLPRNATYGSANILLIVSTNQSNTQIFYSLDNKANETNFFLSDLAEGSHSIIAYAVDAAGNIGKSDIVFFTITLRYPPPTITVNLSPNETSSIPTPSPNPTPTIAPTVTPSPSSSINPIIFPSASPTPQPTAEPIQTATPNSDNAQPENFTFTIIIVGLAALAVAVALLALGKKKARSVVGLKWKAKRE